MSAARADHPKNRFRTGLPRPSCGAQAEVQMVDPNAPELLAALETFANEVQEILNNGEQDAETGPIAAKQKQYMFLDLAVAKLLRTIGRPGAAEPFLSSADAWRDVTERKIQPRLFKVEKADKHAAAKRGRKFDPTETQRIPGSCCWRSGIECQRRDSRTNRTRTLRSVRSVRSVGVSLKYGQPPTLKGRGGHQPVWCRDP